ncbi:MAG: hypothetical protein HKL90_03210 [Elusimicrobia bacterium]|nr:hypothetical protein [Elusimicrobiota bacterium]
MVTRISRLCFVPVALGLLAAIGCGGVAIKPENPNVVVARASASSGLTAALVSKGSTVEGDFGVWSPHFGAAARNSIASSISSKLGDAVRRSGAFGSVETDAAADGSAAVVLSARSSLKFTADEAWPMKSFLTGFTLFIAAPLITYDDRYDASGELTVRGSDETELARYAETYRVDMAHWMILPGQADEMLQSGADAAIAGLAAKLAGDLVRDLDSIKRKAVAKRVRRFSRPAPPHASAPAASAPAPDKPQAPRRTAASADDQIDL